MSEYTESQEQSFHPGQNQPNLDLFDDDTESKIRVAFETITPAIANKLLATNSINQRKVNKTLVARYANQMQKGLWAGGNGETIKISGEGSLIDGQHRLNAVSLAKVAVKFMVMRGIFVDHQVTLDGGKSRTLADVLEIKTGGRIQNTGRIAGAIKLVLIVRNTIARHNLGLKRLPHDVEKKTHLKLSGPEFITEYYKFEDIVEADDEMGELFRRSAISKVTGAYAATAFWFIYSKINRSVAHKVMRVFETGAPLDGDTRCPIFVIRNKIVDQRLNKVTYTGWEYFQFMAYAFECELNNKKMRQAGLEKASLNFFKQKNILQVMHFIAR